MNDHHYIRTATICIPSDPKKSVSILDEYIREMCIRKDGTPHSNFVAGFNHGNDVIYGMVWTSDDASLPETIYDGVSYFGLTGARVGIATHGYTYITSVNAHNGGAELSRQEINAILESITETRSHMR